MATSSCAVCGKWFEAKTARKKTCSDACRMALSRGQTKMPAAEQGDRTEMLLQAVADANEEDLERLTRAVFPLELSDIETSPLELRRQYGPTTDISTMLKLRNLPPHAALLEFLGEEE